MEDESATEMDSNHPVPQHHQSHHQHPLDVNINDSKKRTNNHNQVCLSLKISKTFIISEISIINLG